MLNARIVNELVQALRIYMEHGALVTIRVKQYLFVRILCEIGRAC